MTEPRAKELRWTNLCVCVYVCERVCVKELCVCVKELCVRILCVKELCVKLCVCNKVVYVCVCVCVCEPSEKM